MSKRIVITLITLVLSFAVLAAAAAPAAAGDPGIRHSVFMAGSVIEASAAGVYLCIGTPEGASVGQRLDVVRVHRDPAINPKQGAHFRWEKVGAVRIDAIVEEHFATATVTSGKVRKGDIVRLLDPAGEAKKP